MHVFISDRVNGTVHRWQYPGTSSSPIVAFNNPAGISLNIVENDLMTIEISLPETAALEVSSS